MSLAVLSAVPHADVEISDDPETVQQEVVAVCRQLLPGWTESAEGAQVSPIGGGITNRLFRVVHPAAAATCDAAAAPSAACPAAPPQAVVRLFGDNTELFIDREKELHVMKQLNRAGFGAHVIGTFCNGRVEAWLQARTLDSPDMMRPHLVGMIADHLARFHATEVQLEDTAPQLWPTIRKWIGMAEALAFEGEVERTKHAAIDFAALRRKADAAEAVCGRTASPAVFCHNDLLSGNILALGLPRDQCLASVAAEDVALQLIDFEYSGYSHRGFDWGNFFNECAGFECDWSQYPTREQQTGFLRAYLQAARALKGAGAEPVGEGEVDRALAEAAAFAQASHAYWGTWAILQAKYSDIDFDYFAYSGLRWARFDACVEAVAQQVKAAFGA